MLLSCGDALVDFLPVKSVDGRDAAVPVAGGSCLNIAVGMARLGAPAGFVGGVSTDLFGRIIADHALTSEVDLRYATRSAHQTTLAFVRHVGGEPHYAFYDEATAARNWIYRTGSIPFGEIEAIHVGSTTLANDEGAAQAPIRRANPMSARHCRVSWSDRSERKRGPADWAALDISLTYCWYVSYDNDLSRS